MKIDTKTVVFLTIAALGALASAQEDDAQQVIRSLETDLPFDNDKLRSHFVLFPAEQTNDCSSSFAPPYGFESRVVAGEALRVLFPDYDSSARSCRAVCVERGVDRSLVGAVMPHKYYDSSAVSASLAKWFEETCKRVEVCLMNYHDKTRPVKLYWLKSPEEKVFHLNISYGEKNTRCFSSFIGHSFQAHDGTTLEVLADLTIEHTTVLAFGKSPPSDDHNRHSFDKEIETTLRNEWTRHNRVKRTFSPLGFKKGRLPPDVYASMSAFYENNRWNKVLEEWGGRGVFVNWWDTDVFFIQIPWETKRLWQVRLRELVEAWAGVPLEQTDMYGLRQYESGARLLTHVDRERTHAVSLIVNIAQGNLTEPWPVEVHDHADRLHEVIMEPGDVVYYESAKALHGRNRPLTGENAYYTNLFTHYRPIGDDLWFQKENHEGTPEAVLEVEGECRLQVVGTTETANHQLGLVEAVKCDDKRLGPNISPSLFTATGPEDLIDWWRKTGPVDDSDTPTVDASSNQESKASDEL